MGVRGRFVDKRILLYYEAIDIIHYAKMLFMNQELFLMAITKINVFKVIVILLLLL